MRFDPVSIATSLRQRKLVPNLLTTFLVTSILPGIRVLGGCRQTVYYPLMRYLVAAALGAVGERELIDALRTDARPGVWGHRVLRPKGGDPIKELEENGAALELAANYGSVSLQDAAGDLVSFTGDPIWSDLSAHIKTQAVHAASAEWRWA